MSHLIFNRARKIKQLNRAAKTFYGSDFLHNESANRLAQQFDEIIKKRFDIALNIGTRNGHLTKIIKKNGLVKNIFETDIAINFLSSLRGGIADATIHPSEIPDGLPRSLTLPRNDGWVVADEELLPFRDESFDLIISNLALHWVNDLPGCLAQIKRMLKKGGFFCANIFGGATLQELRSAMILLEQGGDGISPRISPFVGVKDGAALLQRVNFDEPVSASEEITVKYNSVSELLSDLRNTGETNALYKMNNKYPGRNYFNELEKIYKNNYSDENGNLDATFELVTISGWKK